MPTIGVFAAIFDDQRRILCVKRNYGPRNWTLPGGIEPNESPIAALEREVREETVYLVRVGHLIGVYALPPRDDIVLFFQQKIARAAPCRHLGGLFVPSSSAWPGRHDSVTEFSCSDRPHFQSGGRPGKRTMQQVRLSRATRVEAGLAMLLAGIALVVLLAMATVLPSSSAPVVASPESALAATYDAWRVGHQVVVPLAVVLALFLAVDHAYLTGRVRDRFEPRLALGIALFLLILVLLDATTWLAVR